MQFEKAYPYINEALDLWDICLDRLEAVEAASHDWLKADKEPGAGDPMGLIREIRRMPAQRRLLSEVEALLAAYARLSLLLHPVSTASASRGSALRGLLGLPEKGPLSDRDLRNSWMHFDERLEAAIDSGQYGGNECFVYASEVDSDLTRLYVRVLAVDTLDIYIRAQDGGTVSANLRALREPLGQLGEAVRVAHDRYTAPKVRGADGTT